MTARTPTGGSSREYWSMGESLNQRRRVQEEGLRIVNCFLFRESLTHLTAFGVLNATEHSEVR